MRSAGSVSDKFNSPPNNLETSSDFYGGAREALKFANRVGDALILPACDGRSTSSPAATSTPSPLAC